MLVYLIEVLSGSGTAHSKVAKIEEGCVGEIDGETITPYALVYYST
jgi:hypothetical protein